MLRSTLCILLLCASTTVLARDIRMQSPNGEEGTCPTAEAEANDDAKPVTPRAPTPAKRAKQPTTVRSGDNTRTHGPRWHSFLPGMFR
ncbi:MAG: hypothetical protein M3Q13_02400 [Pseudomonadota bacterium]|nr:hypothetical protein [Pseudomonadota bacterium]